MSELAVHQSTELSIVPDQSSFTPAQRTALAHIGVENATDADIEVFFHVVKRTGLDPFARQIYMIGRNSKMWDPRTKQEKWVTKFTIQTGIDGYRLIGRRAANAAGATVSLKPVQWAHEDGGWRDVWIGKWGNPVAARVTIVRSGEEFTATALFDEYKQTTKAGDLTQMWRQRPAGQIGKCAEALAWRMAFPQDLSGIYVDEEMQQADVVRPAPVAATRTAKDAVRAAVGAAADPAPSEEPADPDGITPAQVKKLHTSFTELGIEDRPDRLAYSSKIVGHALESSKDLTKAEAHQVIESLIVDIEAKDAEPVVGVVVKDGLDAKRDEIVAAAEEKGANLWAVESKFAELNDGADFYHGTAEQLDAFAQWVAEQPKAA